jgi:signal transduction histidine kinase
VPEPVATLLVVDDNDAGRFVKVQTFRRVGFRVLEASTGTDALRIADRGGLDLIILDVNLPDISGFDVSRRIREQHPTAPGIQILQVSSTALAATDRVRGLEQGADVYLTEPLEPEVLIATVHALLRVRRAEQALHEALERERAARRLAEEASRLRDEFIATLSHELRTPLNAMMGWIWQLRRSPLDSDARTRALDSVERNARLQVQLINDLLDVSRISKGKLPLELRLLDMLSIVNDAIETVRDQAVRHSVRLSVSGESAWVLADEGRLLQIIGNLLTNAVQFTPEHGVIVITTSSEAAEAVLCVTDTGAGIDPAFLPKVFDQFRQGAGLTRKHGGLGLGLAVVRQLTELHGGSVSVSSAGLGHGATFMLRFPREEVAAGEPVLDGPILRGVRVLIAGSAEEDLDVLKTIVEASGAITTICRTSDECRDHLRNAAFDVLLADQLRYGAGREALPEVRQGESGPLIAIMTRDAGQGITSVATDGTLLVPLPVRPIDLVRRLTHELAIRSHRRPA